MMRVTIRRNGIPPLLLSAFVVVAFFASVARAADGDPAEKVSFLHILLTGAEWPGLFIAMMSLASVTIIIEHFWTIRRTTMIPEPEIEATREMIENRRFKECIDYILGRKSMYADVLAAGLRHGRHGFDAMHEAAAERAAAWSSRLFRKVEYLNIIGNLGPLMGLLGTVIGMIRAFSAMQATHGAYKPEDLAGGIGLALVNTFLGLAVAIVSLGFFGVCRNRVDAMTVTAHAAVVDLLEYLRSSPPAGSSANASAAGTAPPASPRPEPRP
jgi:biopolymer transport protein ExbB